MTGYIPLSKTIKDLQKMLKSSVLTGKFEVTPHDIIQQVREEPIYNVDSVIREATAALTASDDPRHSLITGDGSKLVVVDKAKLDQVLEIIRKGGQEDDDEQ
jgi:hypothetical protein